MDPKRWLHKLTLNIDNHISRFDCINAYDSFVLSSPMMLPASVQCKAVITQVTTVLHKSFYEYDQEANAFFLKNVKVTNVNFCEMLILNIKISYM